MSGLHDDAAAYALDALDAPELERFEEHLATCESCQQEVAELQDVVSGLAMAEPAPLPPSSLRASVLGAITGVEQLPPLAEPAATTPVLTSVPAAPVASAPVVAASPDPVVDELALRRASRRTRLLSVAVAAVTVVALALGGTVWGLVRQQQDQPPVAGPAPTVTVPQVDPSLLAAPDARILNATVNGAAASFVVSKRLNRAAFVSADLPAPPSGDVYHLWLINGATPAPDVVFTASGQTAQSFTGQVAAANGLAINLEPAGTSPQIPTTPVLAIAKI